MFTPQDVWTVVAKIIELASGYWDVTLLSMLALGCACRERGQGHRWLGTTGARILFWGIPVGLVIFWLTGWNWQPGLVAGLSAYVGMAIVPHGAGQNLRVPWKDGPGVVWPEDDTLHGICVPERLGYLLSAAVSRLWMISLALSFVTPWAILLPFGGVSMPLGYAIGLKMPLLPWRLTNCREWGELLTGMGFGLSIVVTLILGGGYVKVGL